VNMKNTAETAGGGRSPFLRALVLAAACSSLWLFAQCLVQAALFGGEGAGGDRDFGLATVLSGWALSILIGALLSGPAARTFLGQYSLSGFLAVVLAVPAATLHWWISPFGTESETGRFLTRMFHYLGGFGSLPEGRKGWAPFHSLYFIWLYALSFPGFYLTAFLAKRNRPPEKIVVENVRVTVNRV